MTTTMTTNVHMTKIMTDKTDNSESDDCNDSDDDTDTDTSED